MGKRSVSGKIFGAIARAVARTPAPLMRLVAGEPIVRDGLTLDLQVQFMMKLFVTQDGAIPSIPRMRRDTDTMGSWLAQRDTRAGLSVESLQLDGPAGVIPARLYRPHMLNISAPALVFFHGGGYVIGSLESHDLPCRRLALDAGCIVVAVDYRLAPEHPFPAGIEDSIAAFRQVGLRAAELGIDASRIAVGGDSAGGGISAVVAQVTRSDAIAPCFQMLWAPWVDLSCRRRSHNAFAQGFFLDTAHLQWYCGHYLPQPSDALDPRASPMLGDVCGVAPAAVLVAGFDPLHDEGEAYAQKLREAGVPVLLRHYTGLTHPFINIAGSVKAASTAFDEASAILRRAFSDDKASPPAHVDSPSLQVVRHG